MSTTVEMIEMIEMIERGVRAFQRALRKGGKVVIVIGKELFFAISKFNPTEEELKAAEAAFELFAKRFGVSGAETLGFTKRFSNGQVPYYAKLFAAFARAGMLTPEIQKWVFEHFLVSTFLPQGFNSGFPGWSKLQKLNKAGQYGTPQWVELQAGLVNYQDTYVFAKLLTMSCMDPRVVLLQRLVAARERKSLLSKAVTRHALEADEKKKNLAVYREVVKEAAWHAQVRAEMEECLAEIDEFNFRRDDDLHMEVFYKLSNELAELACQLGWGEQFLLPMWQNVTMYVPVSTGTDERNMVAEVQDILNFLATEFIPHWACNPYYSGPTLYTSPEGLVYAEVEAVCGELLDDENYSDEVQIVYAVPTEVPILDAVPIRTPQKPVPVPVDVNDYIVPPSAPPAKPWADDEEDLDSLGDPEKLFGDSPGDSNTPVSQLIV